MDSPDEGIGNAEPDVDVAQAEGSWRSGRAVAAAVGVVVAVFAVAVADPGRGAVAPADSRTSGPWPEEPRPKDTRRPADIVAVDAGCRRDEECDDGQPCTRDGCSFDRVCVHHPIASVACRPRIEVERPARGATLLGSAGDTVSVVGSVHTGYGRVTSLTLNGAPVPLADDGTFDVAVDVRPGGNTLSFEARDDNGWSRRRVQSLLWSTGYRKPTARAPMEVAVLASIGSDAVDDGRRSGPLDDAATIAATALSATDLAAFVDAKTAVAKAAGYQVFVDDVVADRAEVELSLIDDGVHVEAALLDVVGALRFDCTKRACVLAGGDDSGSVGIERIGIAADIEVQLSRGGMVLPKLKSLEPEVGALSLSSQGAWTNFLLGVAEPKIASVATGSLRSSVRGALAGGVGPAGRRIAGESNVVVSNLGDGPDHSARVELALSALKVSGDPDGRISATFSGRAHPVDQPPLAAAGNLGIPDQVQCSGASAQLALPGRAAIELGVTDGMVNELLHAAWRGGLLDISIGELEVSAQGLLPPTVGDCHPGRDLRVHIGDLMVDGPDYTAAITMAMAITLELDAAAVSLVATEVTTFDVEVSGQDDEAMRREPRIAAELEATVSDRMLQRMAPLARIAWPDFDLSRPAGLVPGSVVLAPVVRSVARRPGLTVAVVEL